MKSLRLEPNDVIVVKATHNMLSLESWKKKCSEDFQAAFPGHRILFVPEDVEIELIHRYFGEESDQKENEIDEMLDEMWSDV